MATAERERDLDRSPTPSTSLLPVSDAYRKLNGHARSAGDDDIAETSFGVRWGDRPASVDNVPATEPHVDYVCIPTTSREGASTAAVMDRFYLDTKGGAGDGGLNGVGHNSQRSTDPEAGSPTTSSRLAAGGRSAYARVADVSSLPPEVEQLRPDCVISGSSSSDVQHATENFALWEFVTCAALLTLVVPCCGIPALIFAVRSQSSYRQGDVSASRATNLSALRLITIGGVCLCVLAVTASVLIAVFSHDNGGTAEKISTALTAVDGLSTGASTGPRQRGMSISGDAFEKALQRHQQATLDNQRRTVNSRPSHSGGFDAMIRKFSGVRPTAMSTTGSGVNT